MGIMQMAGLLQRLGATGKVVDQSRCVHVRNRNCRCLRCAEACPSGCISVDQETSEVLVDINRCIGCGTCATVCPTGALTMANPTDSELLKELAAAAERNDGVAVVSCRQLLSLAAGLYDPDKVVEVPCLGRLEEGLLLSLAAMGATEIILVHGPCQTCSYASGSQVAHEVVATTNSLLEVWNSPVRADIRAKLPAQVRLKHKEDDLQHGRGEGNSAKTGETELSGSTGYDADRREFLTDARKQIGLAAMMAAGETEPASIDEQSVVAQLKVRKDGTLPHRVPNRRLRTLSALRKLGEPADEMIGTRLWGHVIIDTDVCQSCRMCATFCPTGALEKFDEDGEFGVDHGPSACSKCRSCETICPVHAITISDEVFALDIYEGATERYVMRPNATLPDNPHQMYHALRTMFDCDQLYER